MNPVLDGLNEGQLSAVTTTRGPVLVVAGPGTGKTLTLVRRIAYLVDEGVKPEEILAVTFTNRAAREMGERTHRFLGPEAHGIFIGTFHLLGLRIMRENLEGNFGVCGREEQIGILSGLTGGLRKAERMAERISKVKNFVEEENDEVKQIHGAYENALRERALYDFDDLIRVPLDLWEKNAIRGGWGTAFRYIMVDEYQDINPAQYRLMRRLVNEGNNICAVGDSDQAIYAFRGADVENFLSFERDFTDARRVVLSRNYRSSRIILDASSAMIRHNRKRLEKGLETLREVGARITVLTTPDEKSEARTVVAEIEAQMGGTSHYNLLRATTPGDTGEGSCSFRDFAVIYRTNAQAKVMEEAFLESGIPFQIVNANGPAGMERIRDNLQRLIEKGAPVPDLAGLAESLCDESEVSDGDRALLFQIVSAYSDLSPEIALPSIVNELVLLSSGDTFDPRADAVILMTLHAAKGLEFKVVFIAGMEDGLVPSAMAKGQPDGEEEERRLFYVGMTRAKDHLMLIRAETRLLYGERCNTAPSPFLGEIPGIFIETRTIQRAPKSRKQRQMKLF